jgi:hypothetical protein
MLIAALSALVLHVAPAQYDATFYCECKPQTQQTSGILTTRARSGGDFDVDYSPVGVNTLEYALRAGRQIVTDSPGLQASSKWQSTVNVLIVDQAVSVPVGASVVAVANGIATIEVHGQLNSTPVHLTVGTIPVSITVDFVVHVKLGQSADDQPSLTSLTETMIAHYDNYGGRPYDATVKAALTAKSS